MIAHCGLNCGQCDVYLATQADDDAKRAETAQAWSKHFGWQLVPEDINCDGCLRPDGRLFKFCSQCQVRTCCSGKNLATCADCGEYLCPKIEGMIKMVPQIGACLENLRQAR